jgi:ribosomal protein S18 acetylase RimI-like enzyme
MFAMGNRLPDPAVEIINLAPDDWQAYRQLRLEALQESPLAFGSTYQEQLAKPDAYWQSRLQDAADGEKSWLRFARAGTRLVGLLGAFRGRHEDHTVSDEATVIAVYVSPDWRGRGVSILLMQSILDALRENGFRLAHLGVNGQQTAAVNLYLRFGFAITRTIINRAVDGREYENYYMEKVL